MTTGKSTVLLRFRACVDGGLLSVQRFSGGSKTAQLRDLSHLFHSHSRQVGMLGLKVGSLSPNGPSVLCIACRTVLADASRVCKRN